MNTKEVIDGGENLSASKTGGGAQAGHSSRVFVVSGAAGFLGSHFLFSRISEPDSFVALVQGDTTGEAQERLRKRLETCAASHLTFCDMESLDARLTIVPCDLNDEGFSTRETLTAEICARGADQFWHFPTAHDTAEDATADARRRSEVEIRNALHLAEQFGSKLFIYVSTAYAVGRAPQTVPEELHAPSREFNNSCEESHCHAEHEVAAYCNAHGMNYRILRPSIVVGPSPSLKTGGASGGLYGFIGELNALRSTLSEAGDSFSVVADPQAAVNLIPVDYLTARINDLVKHEFAGGPIYHLTSSDNPTVETMLGTIWEALGLPQPLKFAGAGAERTPVEALFDAKVAFYAGYLQSDKEFEEAAPRPGGVSEPELYGYVAECLRELREQTVERLFRREWIRGGADDTMLPAFTGGNPDGAAVVLCNAIGMPAVFWLPLGERLAPHFKILTWESRGVPNLYGTFDSQSCGVGNHVADLVSLLDFHQVESAHLVGWCSGVHTALKFASSFRTRTRSITLLNGAFNLPPIVPRTTFEKNLRTLIPKIAANPAYAALYHKMSAGNRSQAESTASPTGSGQGMMSGAPMCRNPLLRHLTAAPFKTPEMLFRYANLIARTLNEPEPDWNSFAGLPVLIISSDGDQISHPEASREVARRIEGAELAVNEEGDHHSLYDDARVGEILLSFLLRHEDDERRGDDRP